MSLREVFKIIEDIVSKKQEKIVSQLDILSDMLEDCNQALTKATGQKMKKIYIYVQTLYLSHSLFPPSLSLFHVLFRRH
jgi:hypothetical protein